MLAAGLSLSLLTLTSCEEEEVLPSVPGVPSTGTPPTTPPANPAPPANPTPPATPAPPVTTNSLLTQLGTKVLKYDAQNRLVEVSYTDQQTHGYTVVYEGNKAVRLNFRSGGYLLYTYEGDKVVAAARYYGDNLVNYRYAFEYSGDKLVKQKQWSYAVSDAGFLTVNAYSYDANGNLTSILVSAAASGQEADLARSYQITWGGYDAKPNPMPFAESTIFLPGVKLFANNPGYRDSGSSKELFSYLYHESGMPDKRYTRLEGYPHVPAFTDTYTYQ